MTTVEAGSADCSASTVLVWALAGVRVRVKVRVRVGQVMPQEPWVQKVDLFQQASAE